MQVDVDPGFGELGGVLIVLEDEEGGWAVWLEMGVDEIDEGTETAMFNELRAGKHPDFRGELVD